MAVDSERYHRQCAETTEAELEKLRLHISEHGAPAGVSGLMEIRASLASAAAKTDVGPLVVNQQLESRSPKIIT